jgi:hypothetical protein
VTSAAVEAKRVTVGVTVRVWVTVVLGVGILKQLQARETCALPKMATAAWMLA